MDLDNELKKRAAFELGMALDDLSVEELHEHISMLEAEIARLREAISAKTASRSAADAVFKF